ARYGHRVNFLREDKQLAAKAITVTENREGYDLLRTEIEALHGRHSEAMFHVHIDAAGQYAANLETFLRSLTMPMIVLHRDFREPSKIRLGPSIGFTVCSAASFPNSP
ncbi:MAG TPA: hypothetical protein PLR25_15420, partial [Planctomycetaceae bacterium]|nr:hypothetical protein [Planctomycetaceae bacterium]